MPTNANRILWSRYNTRIKARGYNDGGAYQTSVVLPVDTLEVRAEPYVPEGGTVLELYDDRRKYRVESYGYIINLEYDYERTDYRSSQFDYLHELVGILHVYDWMDIFVNYDDTNGTFANSTAGAGQQADYKCLKMIPDVTEDMAPSVFQKQAAEKPRQLELLSHQRSYSKSTVEWIFE
jgi:hypothetical protein